MCVLVNATVKNMYGFIIVSLIVLTTATFPVAQGADDSIVVKDSVQALELALAYTGFEEYPDFELKDALCRVEEVTFRDSTMPFLTDSLDGLPAWEVTLTNVIVHDDASMAGLDKKNPKDIAVSIDRKTGKLLRIIVLVHGLTRQDMYVKATSEYATVGLSGSENYILGLPDVHPPVSFVKALDAVCASPLLAREIAAYFVLESELDRGPHVVWDIHLYGIPPLPVNGPVPLEQRNHMRSVIFAETCKLWFCTTAPQPEP